MTKKKQEKKEKKAPFDFSTDSLEVTNKLEERKIDVQFGEIRGRVEAKDGRVTDIHLQRGMFSQNSVFISNEWSPEEIEMFIAVLRKIIAIYDALNVLHGGKDD